MLMLVDNYPALYMIDLHSTSRKAHLYYFRIVAGMRTIAGVNAERRKGYSGTLVVKCLDCPTQQAGAIAYRCETTSAPLQLNQNLTKLLIVHHLRHCLGKVSGRIDGIDNGIEFTRKDQ